MNTLIKAAGASVDFGWVIGGVTILFLGVFLWWTWMAYSPRNRARWDEAAQMPFMDGDAE